MELRTSGQSTNFIVSIARGGSSDDWHLTDGADSDAIRVWAERAAIGDLGIRLRREGRTWACELVENSIRLRNSFGLFTKGDRESLANTAKILGAEPGPIEALSSDVLRLSISDLTTASATLCP